MKITSTILWMAALTVVASAQTQTNPAGTAPTPAAKPATAAAPAAAASKTTSTVAAKPATATALAVAPWIKLPPGVPKVTPPAAVKAIPFTVHYQDIKIGAGAEAESGKIWQIKYTEWRAADGVQIDTWNSDAHKKTSLGKDGKPETGPDGKPKMTDAEPAKIVQGAGRISITGLDYGLAGMKIGGKRRIFIPWQLGFGMRSIPDRTGQPGIPAKSDLIIDVELVGVTDVPAAPARPAAATTPGGYRVVPQNGQTQSPAATVQPGAAPGTPAAPATPAATPAAPVPAATPDPDDAPSK